MLTATGSIGGTLPYSYAWSNNLDPLFNEMGASFSVSPTADTEYTVTVTDDNGCTSSDVVLVKAYNVACDNGNNDKVSVCITTPSGNNNTICVSSSAVTDLLASNPNATMGNCTIFKTDHSIIAEEVLIQNNPNPFSNATRFDIQVPEDGSYQLKVLDYRQSNCSGSISFT